MRLDLGAEEHTYHLFLQLASPHLVSSREGWFHIMGYLGKTWWPQAIS